MFQLTVTRNILILLREGVALAKENEALVRQNEECAKFRSKLLTSVSLELRPRNIIHIEKLNNLNLWLGGYMGFQSLDGNENFMNRKVG